MRAGRGAQRCKGGPEALFWGHLIPEAGGSRQGNSPSLDPRERLRTLCGRTRGHEPGGAPKVTKQAEASRHACPTRALEPGFAILSAAPHPSSPLSWPEALLPKLSSQS